MIIKTYFFYWLTGKCERGEGTSPANALTMLGYGAGAVGALDFYEESAKPSYEWNAKAREWMVPVT